MAEVRAVLDTVLALRMAAAAVGANNPKGAENLTKQAEALYFGGEPDASSAKDAVKMWEEAYGGSMDDPEFRNKVYDLVSKYRKMESDKSAEEQKQREARAKLTAEARLRAQGKIRRGPRGRPQK